MTTLPARKHETTWVSCLTPVGVGAIATLAVVGPDSWQTVRILFHGASSLPAEPIAGRTWHGWLGDAAHDDVVISANPARAQDWVEVHCHGGVEIVRLLLETFESQGCVAIPWQQLLQRSESVAFRAEATMALSKALTLRTADVLLWQAQRAFERALIGIQIAIGAGDLQSASDRLRLLARHTRLGRHLTQPWRIAIAGAPNAGKSSLMNALAGYQRSIVAPTAGTTRDVITTLLAFDGWPATAADTAGIRTASDGLEQAGVERAQREIHAADLCIWLLDGSAEPVWPSSPTDRMLLVVNKADLPAGWDFSKASGAVAISALTGQGIVELSHAIAQRLVPEPPQAGEAVPFTEALCDAIDQAWALMQDTRHPRLAWDVITTLLQGAQDRETVQGS